MLFYVLGNPKCVTHVMALVWNHTHGTSALCLHVDGAEPWFSAELL